jgi:EAL domain-containing protein (putative c-di-GMP-specific phosphodiesterase class I)/ActR/RegA family two-component response regulator
MVSLGEHLSSGSTNVLLVNDDPDQRRAQTDALQRQGYWVSIASDGSEALALLTRGAFDCVVNGLSRPELDAVRLLRAIREHDLDVPVIVETACPSVESAAQAVEWSAFRYLIKPVQLDRLLELVGLATETSRAARLRRAAYAYLERIGFPSGVGAREAGEFEAALSQIWMAFQPIVQWSERRVIGYEALVRSRSPVFAHPHTLLEAADRLGRLHDLGQSIRNAVAEVARTAPGELVFFVNVQAQDLLDAGLYGTGCPLSAVAHRVVLEITERASLEHIDGLGGRIARLRGLGYRIAVDDLGAGYAGLSSFAQLKPDVIKLDMTLTRNVHADSTRRSVVESLARLCRELGVTLVAEGVESEPERDALVNTGCQLFQGFLFGRPGVSVTSGAAEICRPACAPLGAASGR